MNFTILIFGGILTMFFFGLPLGLLLSNGIDINNPPCLKAVGAEFACHSVQGAFIVMMAVGAGVIPAGLILEKTGKLPEFLKEGQN